MHHACMELILLLPNLKRQLTTILTFKANVVIWKSFTNCNSCKCVLLIKKIFGILSSTSSLPKDPLFTFSSSFLFFITPQPEHFLPFLFDPVILQQELRFVFHSCLRLRPQNPSSNWALRCMWCSHWASEKHDSADRRANSSIGNTAIEVVGVDS